MLQRCLPFFLVLTIFTSITSYAQQPKWPKTLLWRISGNGLSKPSYLYGTMHLQDKRVFHFTDSVYKAIETTDGFALEVDFNELIDSLINVRMSNVDEDYEFEKVEVDRKKLGKDIDSIFRNLGIDAENLTAKNLKKIREYRVRRLTQQGEMPTIVDGYLFGLANRHGKWTGGIEDVTDQLDLVDEIGDVLTPEKAFEPEAKLRASLEAMIRVYMDSDLEGINSFIESSYDNDYKNKLLINRNVKMARRMDSLLKWRSMFFAVGAAHLPGDSGVIRLLRARGFQVEPVFSPRTITPQSYSAKLANVPWKVSDEDAFYSVEMPGTPGNFDRFGEAVRMKMFFDLPTMTYYMVGHTIRVHENYSELSQSFRDMVKNMGGNSSKMKLKDVSGNGLVGVEGSFEIPAGYYRVRLLQKKKIMYMLLTGSTKKANLNDDDVNKFYNSFKAKDAPLVANRFQTFTIPGKDFTVDLPGIPKPNREIDRSAENSNWYFSTYDLADREKGLYYMVQVRDIKPGHFLEGDSSYFNVFSEELAGTFEIVKKDYFTFQGWNAMKMEFMDEGKLRYQMYTVVRGNRVYTLFGGGQKTSAPEIDTVFGSFRLTPPPSQTWKKHSAHGFSTLAPASVELEKPLTDEEEEDEEEDGGLHFVSYDPTKVISYEVSITPMSQYFWAESDSVFFEERLKGNREFGDTLLTYERIKTGKLPGAEFVLRNKGSNTVKKIRAFVNGDSLYLLFALMPEVYLDDENGKRFFTEFRLNNEKQPTIYTNKAKQLLTALLTKDSADFVKAAEVIEQVTFTKKDLPYLHEAFLKEYTFEHSYRSINSRISEELENLKDSSTVDFIAKHYKEIDKDQTDLKYEALDVLASITTKPSYLVLKDLLLSYPLDGESHMVLAWSLKDSLELTRLLYPEILKLADNSEFGDVLSHITVRMIDSGFLTRKDFLPYRDAILAQAAKKVEEVKNDPENWWDLADWPAFTGIFNDAESNQLLQDFLATKEPNIRYHALLALAKNNQGIPKNIIEEVAENKEFRLSLYIELQKMNKLDIFPSKYATQQKLAESEVYAIAGEEDEYPNSVVFVGERKAMFMGKEGVFYIFKVTFGEDGDTYSYMGVSGPYANKKEILTSSRAAGLYYEDEYDKNEIDTFLRAYLLDWEEYYKEFPEEK